MKKKIVTVLVAVLMALALALLTGCGASDSDCQGDPGRVLEKDSDPATKHRVADYDVVIQRDNPRKGQDPTYEKDVTSTAYDWVKKGSRWPSSKHCKDGKAK